MPNGDDELRVSRKRIPVNVLVVESELHIQDALLNQRLDSSSCTAARGGGEKCNLEDNYPDEKIIHVREDVEIPIG
jgi:hypothetical protein